MNTIEDIKAFKGGEHSDTPVSEIAIDCLEYILRNCKEYNLPTPEIFPWAGGNGAQAEWDYKDWYIEISICTDDITCYCEKSKTQYIELNLSNIKDAFEIAKIIIINNFK